MRFLYGFLKKFGRYDFLSGFPTFSFTETVRGCMSLKKHADISSKAVEVTVNNKKETFVWISSKNSASGLKHVSELTEEFVRVEL